LDVKSNQVTPEAFFLRPKPKDSDGLSVSHTSALDAVTPDGTPLDWFGIASLHVGKIRAIDSALDVVPDSPTHANVTGLVYREDDEGKAQFFADKLSEGSRLCCVDLRMKPK